MTEMHRGDAAEVSAVRLAEDIGHWRAVGAARTDLGLPDCTVRSARWQDWFEVPCPPATGARLAEAIAAALIGSPWLCSIR
jgi:hypothetical protein